MISAQEAIRQWESYMLSQAFKSFNICTRWGIDWRTQERIDMAQKHFNETGQRYLDAGREAVVQPGYEHLRKEVEKTGADRETALAVVGYAYRNTPRSS